MGAIFETFSAELPLSLVKEHANNVIESDYSSRRSEEDMYRGDFGSSVFGKLYSIEELKALNNIKTKKIKVEKAKDLAEELLMKKEKYSLNAVVVQELGYAYFTLGCPFSLPVSRQGYIIKKANTWVEKSFKNITELKKFLATADCSWYKANIYTGDIKVGTVGYKNFKVYKTRPKAKPAKYAHSSQMVKVLFGGWNPY